MDTEDVRIEQNFRGEKKSAGPGWVGVVIAATAASFLTFLAVYLLDI
jgi:hypothetical protein